MTGTFLVQSCFFGFSMRRLSGLIVILCLSFGVWANQNQVLIKGGNFVMGSDDGPYPVDNEGPTRNVHVDSFFLDKYEVQNRDFQKFVKQTQYVTDAEKFGWSFVVENFLSPEEDSKATQAAQQAPWWAQIYGAAWFAPEGSDSDIDDRESNPVVHVSWNDAKAFCAWAGKRLPSEAEWEYAARGGLHQKLYPWGDEHLGENKKHMANLFQGTFPHTDQGKDGFIGLAPVGSFPPNNFGLYDMAGNVWEWTEDSFDEESEDKVCKGGSFMCHRSFCYRWRCSARMHASPDSSSYNVGFRCAQDIEQLPENEEIV